MLLVLMAECFELKDTVEDEARQKREQREREHRGQQPRTLVLAASIMLTSVIVGDTQLRPSIFQVGSDSIRLTGTGKTDSVPRAGKLPSKGR
jgi:hypothetical protein